MENNENIKIAEKVKFWEEQDRINKSIIPRILKNHDLINELTGKITNYTEALITLETRLAKVEKKTSIETRQTIIPYIVSGIAIIVSIIAIFS